jgi:hypothetical protein
MRSHSTKGVDEADQKAKAPAESETVCPSVFQLAKELQIHLLNSKSYQEIEKKAADQALKIVSGEKSNFKVNIFKDETKLDNLLKDFMDKITTLQNTDGYSEEVDRYFKTSVTIEVLEKNNETVVGGMDLVSSNGRGTPIVTLPSRITYANGDKIEFEKGLKNDNDLYDAFKTKYANSTNPSWGEGRLFYCKPDHVTDLMLCGMKEIVNKEWSGAFALASKGTPMAKILEVYGFERAKEGDKNAIDSIEFTGGDIPKLDDNGNSTLDANGISTDNLNVPEYSQKYLVNGTEKTKNKEYLVYFLKAETAESIFKKSEVNKLPLPKEVLNLQYIHA